MAKARGVIREEVVGWFEIGVGSCSANFAVNKNLYREGRKGVAKCAKEITGAKMPHYAAGIAWVLAAIA